MYKLPTITEREKKDNVLYILTDGSVVNTQVESENGSTRRENKLVRVYLHQEI